MRDSGVLLCSFLAVSLVLAMQAPPLEAQEWWEAIEDGSFELGNENPFWSEYSQLNQTVIRYVDPTKTSRGWRTHTGDWYAHFGSDYYPEPDQAWLSQLVQFGQGEAHLTFWWKRLQQSENSVDALVLWVDNTQIWINRPLPGTGSEYDWIEETIPISFAADGGIHNIHFEMTNTGTSNTGNGTWWLVDDVSIMTHDLLPLETDFTWRPIEPVAGEDVVFYPDLSGRPDSWIWDFGDGTTSDEVNPHHVFENPGQYLVTFEISRDSDSSTAVMEHTITVAAPFAAEFTWSPELPSIEETVAFTDLSTGDPTGWHWDFGDGHSSDNQHPTHYWTAVGDYPVTLTITRPDTEASSATHQLTVSDAPMTAAFAWKPPKPQAGMNVKFFDLSSGEPDTWLWLFGEGHTSEEKDPIHVYEQTGQFAVTLTVSRSDNPDVTSTSQQTIEILEPAPRAWFEWTPNEPDVGTVVRFSDLSEGEVLTWLWDFGDGQTSTNRSPSHVYTEGGTFDVKLIVTNPDGLSGSATQQLYVNDDPYRARFSWTPPEVHAGQAVAFQDLSRGEPTTWLWNFGDGRFSTLQNPTHWFDATKNYNVTLTVTFGPDGAIQRSSTKTIEVGQAPLESDFLWTPYTPNPGEAVSFTDVSRGDPTSWSWDFGDGSTSEEPNPVHTFASPGQYTITLTGRRGDVKIMDTSTRTRTIDVRISIPVDFDWDPRAPQALTPIEFTEDIGGSFATRLWDFGDSQTSTEENPTHIYRREGAYRVFLWALDVDGAILGLAEHHFEVLPPDIEITLTSTNDNPNIGEAVNFQLSPPIEVKAVRWAFGGLGCDGNQGNFTCAPIDNENCMTTAFTFATRGLKPVRAWLILEDDTEIGPFSTAVRVNSSGRCSAPPQADFSWWPPEPTAGQPVRCVDRSVGPPNLWTWTFDDGSTASMQHTTHIFESAGAHDVELAIANSNGLSTVTQTITVNPPIATCGNTICEPEETTWSCPEDCFEDPEGTGRNGRKHTNLVVPAAVGGVHGANDTYWVTEGSIVNPGNEDSKVIVEFVPDNHKSAVLVAGPSTIPPHSAIHFDNLVQELFGVHTSGSLWIDADTPVIANTRTFNTTGESTFGQGIGGITTNDVFGADDGSVFIVGLKQDDAFRTNFLFQETSGHDATVNVLIFNFRGQEVAKTSVTVPSRTKWQKPMTHFGVSHLDAGYAILSVAGEGKIAAIGSVIDQTTGDATTLDAVHSLQAGAGSSAKAGESGDSHFLIAVVARAPGSNQTVWRSEVSILNPGDSDQVLRLVYVPPNGERLKAFRELPAGAMFFSEDVIEDVFPKADNGVGSLHIHAQQGLIVNSRTYNVLPDQSTVGQNIPGLARGDMARPGEIWLLDSLKQTQAFRCNLGFAEFEGSPAEVTVVLFDTDGASMFFLASKTYSVPPHGQFQVNKVFRDMGLNRNYREAIAFVSVASEKGAVYSYASIVDNKVGDGTTILGKRQ